MIRPKNKKTDICVVVLAAIGVAGLTVFAIAVAVGFREPPVPTEAITTDQDSLVSRKTEVTDENYYGTPTRLVIPKIGVDTSIEQVGLTATGDMEAPQTDDKTGWYKYGSRPGNLGSAVIAGHLGLSGNAVFGQLDQLVVGDVLSVTDEQGQVASFAVRETRRYRYDETPKEVFVSTTGTHLNLITCDGSWEDSQNTYSQRLVIFANKVD